MYEVSQFYVCTEMKNCLQLLQNKKYIQKCLPSISSHLCTILLQKMELKKKINEHSTSKYFVTIGIYRYISNKSLQFAVFIFIKIFHAKTFLNKLMKKCLLLLKTLECIVFRGQLIQWLLFQKSNYTSLIQLQSKLLQVIKFKSYYIFFTQKKIYLYI